MKALPNACIECGAPVMDGAGSRCWLCTLLEEDDRVAGGRPEDFTQRLEDGFTMLGMSEDDFVDPSEPNC